MVVSVARTSVDVNVAVGVIFNFSAMVAMFTKAAIDFLVTVVMQVTTVTNVSMVTFAIVITKATIPRRKLWFGEHAETFSLYVHLLCC